MPAFATGVLSLAAVVAVADAASTLEKTRAFSLGVAALGDEPERGDGEDAAEAIGDESRVGERTSEEM